MSGRIQTIKNFGIFGYHLMRVDIFKHVEDGVTFYNSMLTVYLDDGKTEGGKLAVTFPTEVSGSHIAQVITRTMKGVSLLYPKVAAKANVFDATTMEVLESFDLNATDYMLDDDTVDMDGELKGAPKNVTIH